MEAYMIAKGLLAGAAGTLALDLYTYLDILARARPPSEVPSTVVQKLAEKLGVESLANNDGDAPKNRRSGAGALMGYGVGLGAGVAYCAVRPAFERWLPWPLAGVLLGGATLVASEGSATALGATDWSTWSASDWASDIIPRTLYGLTVAYVCEKIEDDG
ncbi:MAG: hypothetical protein IAI50_08535 [Candidatus Eremiobacteraeota bacterium]|nr:hypothetical protein [Candidatus Eremiobacteraeota bacterium]